MDNSTPKKPEANQNAAGRSNRGSLTKATPTESNAIQIPQISLPKGGGALKGIDEKFEVNAANGTAGFSIPLPVTPGRNGFSPSLALCYNSGGGNSILGIEWSLNFPIIQRKTDKKLPRYLDYSEEKDTFKFSGVEDLVPKLKYKNGKWGKVERKIDTGYFIQESLPRVEVTFSRIERIRNLKNALFGAHMKDLTFSFISD